MSLLTKIVTGVFGKKSVRDLKILSPFIKEINDYYDTLSELSDDELKIKFISIKDEYKHLENEFKNNNLDKKESNQYFDELDKIQNNFLDDKMIEVFAIVKDASRRLLNTKFFVMEQDTIWDMVHYDVQLIGGVVLHKGKIAEMKTGEG